MSTSDTNGCMPMCLCSCYKYDRQSSVYIACCNVPMCHEAPARKPTTHPNLLRPPIRKRGIVVCNVDQMASLQSCPFKHVSAPASCIPLPMFLAITCLPEKQNQFGREAIHIVNPRACNQHGFKDFAHGKVHSTRHESSKPFKQFRLRLSTIR